MGKKINLDSIGGVKAIGGLEWGKRRNAPIYKIKKAESYENPLKNAQGHFISWSILTVKKHSEKILDNLILIDF